MNYKIELSRLSFLKFCTLSFLSTDFSCWLENKQVRFGVVADLHHGIYPKALIRLQTFIDMANERKMDCIIQLGDFNYGKPNSVECMEVWSQFHGEKFHVLGNHDMDINTKEQMVNFLSMPNRYYSFDRSGFHFVILDRNNLRTPDGYIPYKNGNFYVNSQKHGHADLEQLEGLKNDLTKTQFPTVVFMHQRLGLPDSTNDVQSAIELVFEQINQKTNFSKIVAYFCGHSHLDYYNFKNGIHYIWINSISYYWVGEKYGKMAPYQDPLYAFILFDSKGFIKIEGCSTQLEPPSPEDRGYPNPERLTTFISNRQLTFET